MVSYLGLYSISPPLVLRWMEIPRFALFRLPRQSREKFHTVSLSFWPELTYSIGKNKSHGHTWLQSMWRNATLPSSQKDNQNICSIALMITTVHPYVQQIFGSLFFMQSILTLPMSSYQSEVIAAPCVFLSLPVSMWHYCRDWSLFTED